MVSAVEKIAGGSYHLLVHSASGDFSSLGECGNNRIIEGNMSGGYVVMSWNAGVKAGMRDAKPIQYSDLSELFQEILKKEGFLRFRALGGSMFPFIRPGDFLTTKTVDPISISVGEVILYQREGRSFVHRLIKKKIVNGVPLFITRGDHLPFYDPPVRSPQILGRVIRIERSGRTIHLDTSFQLMWGRFLASTTSCLFPSLQIVERAFHYLRRLSSKAN